MAACSGCYNQSAKAAKALENEQERAKIPSILAEMGMSVSDRHIRVRNVVDVLANDLDISTKVRKPLVGLKVACYYGCLLTRPAEIAGWDSPLFPISMDKLAQACGAEVVDFRAKTKCCGGPILVPKEDVAL